MRQVFDLIIQAAPSLDDSDSGRAAPTKARRACDPHELVALGTVVCHGQFRQSATGSARSTLFGHVKARLRARSTRRRDSSISTAHDFLRRNREFPALETQASCSRHPERDFMRLGGMRRSRSTCGSSPRPTSICAR
jgi:hypothetical protein